MVQTIYKKCGYTLLKLATGCRKRNRVGVKKINMYKVTLIILCLALCFSGKAQDTLKFNDKGQLLNYPFKQSIDTKIIISKKAAQRKDRIKKGISKKSDNLKKSYPVFNEFLHCKYKCDSLRKQKKYFSLPFVQLTEIEKRISDSLNEKQKQYIKTALLNRIQISINTLEDDSLPYKKLYDNLWGSGVVDSIIRELKELKNWLKNKNYTLNKALPFTYVPSINEIDSMLESKKIFELKPPNLNELIDNNTNYCEFQLIYKDPFKEWFLNKYNKSIDTYGSIKTLEMNPQYKHAWDQLTALQKQLKDYADSLDTIAKYPYSTCPNLKFEEIKSIGDSIKNLEMRFNENFVIKIIKDNKTNKSADFFKKWLWFTGGLITFNPLKATTLENRYGVNSKNDGTKSDAQIDTLNQIKRVWSTINSVSIPLKDNDINKRKDWIQPINATNHFRMDKPDYRKINLPENEQATVLIYNFPSNFYDSIHQSDKSIPDLSKAQSDINSLAEQGAGFISNISGLAASFVKVTSIFEKAGVVLKKKIKNVKKNCS